MEEWENVLSCLFYRIWENRNIFKKWTLCPFNTDRFIGDRISTKKQWLKRSRTTAGLGCNLNFEQSPKAFQYEAINRLGCCSCSALDGLS
jgi:hypothetical protein